MPLTTHESPEKNPPQLAPPPAASPKSDFPGRTPIQAHQKSRPNPRLQPAAANPSATIGPAQSRNPAPSLRPVKIWRESTAVPTSRDPQSRHPVTRQSQHF